MSGSLRQDIEANFSMDLNNGPEDGGDSKDDVLVGDIKKGSLIFINPVVCLDRATTGTKS